MKAIIWVALRATSVEFSSERYRVVAAQVKKKEELCCFCFAHTNTCFTRNKRAVVISRTRDYGFNTRQNDSSGDGRGKT